MNEDVDVVVIGAGAGGIGAMRALAGSGYSSLLLEASQRLGGRAWTAAWEHGASLDLGCGWLHSADRNSWVDIARQAETPMDPRQPAWGVQHKDLGFSTAEQDEASKALRAWNREMRKSPPASDRALDAISSIPGHSYWRGYVEQIAAAYTGKPLSRISVADYLAYLDAETSGDWRLPRGYGQLIATSLPEPALVRMSTPVTALTLEPGGVAVHSWRGVVRARAAIITVSTNVLAGGGIDLPRQLAPWRTAAADLSLGANEKLFLQILRPDAFETETRVLGDPWASLTGAYYIRPLGMSVIEGFYGGEAADWIAKEGPAAAYGLALDQLAKLFGENVRKDLRPLTISHWSRDPWIQGSYSCAAPGRRNARNQLAQSFDDRLFFAGEATSQTDFSTAHGALDTGIRAAREAITVLGK